VLATDGNGLTSMQIPKIISVDDHVVEPPDVWTSRLPSRYVDVGPHVVRMRGFADPYWVQSDDGEWGDVWAYEDVIVPFLRPAAAVGLGELRFGLVTFDELRPGAWQQAARLRDMDANHVEASVCFPNVLPRFCGQTFAEAKDKQLALLCVQAYNDWIIDEWCAGDGRGRLIPLTIIPLWDADLAVDELRRCAAKGSHAVSFAEDPSALGFPSVYSGKWDSFFAACQETNTVLCMHIGSSSKMTKTNVDSPQIVSSTLTYENSAHSLLDFVFSGTLARFPRLKVAYAEGQVGWIPFIIERADRIWSERSTNSFGTNGVVLAEPPSHYVRRQVFGCIFDDEAGLFLRDRIGMSNICFEVDFPHADTTFPATRDVLTSLCVAADLGDSEAYALARGNAISLFGLERFGIDR
jgi:predicted TIM-barrel fold metal-dependent hydrolase